MLLEESEPKFPNSSDYMLLYKSGVNYNVNSNSTKYMEQLFGRFLHFGIFPPQISESCGATYRRNCEMFSALQSTSGPLETVPKSIHNWTLSFLKVVKKLTKNAVLNLSLCYSTN